MVRVATVTHKQGRGGYEAGREGSRSVVRVYLYCYS